MEKQPPAAITVATWNISGGTFAHSTDLFDYQPGEHPEYFADALGAINPDIVCLAETHIRRGCSESLTDSITQILGFEQKHEVGLHPSHIDNGRSILGIGIVAARAFLACNVPIPGPDFELKFKDGTPATIHQRWLVVANFGAYVVATMHGWPLRVFGCDYATKPGIDYARHLEEALINTLSPDTPLIIAGDLNFDSANHTLPTLMHRLNLREALPGETTRNQGDHPDHILYSPHWQLDKAGIIPGKSEHYLCYAKLQPSSQLGPN